MSQVAKVTISLPGDVLEAVERERGVKGETRSEFFVRAVQDYLRREQDRRDDDQYVRAYRERPETEEEIKEADALAAWAFGQVVQDEGWEAEGWEEEFRKDSAREQVREGEGRAQELPT